MKEKDTMQQMTAFLKKGFKTTTQIANALKVTKPTVLTYLKALGRKRKLETKMVRQGARGPLAIGFKVRS